MRLKYNKSELQKKELPIMEWDVLMFGRVPQLVKPVKVVLDDCRPTQLIHIFTLSHAWKTKIWNFESFSLKAEFQKLTERNLRRKNLKWARKFNVVTPEKIWEFFLFSEIQHLVLLDIKITNPIPTSLPLSLTARSLICLAVKNIGLELNFGQMATKIAVRQFRNDTIRAIHSKIAAICSTSYGIRKKPSEIRLWFSRKLSQSSTRKTRNQRKKVR